MLELEVELVVLVLVPGTVRLEVLLEVVLEDEVELDHCSQPSAAARPARATNAATVAFISDIGVSTN